MAQAVHENYKLNINTDTHTMYKIHAHTVITLNLYTIVAYMHTYNSNSRVYTN